MDRIFATWRSIETSELQPLPRSSHSINIIKDTVYIFGGEIREREPVGNEINVYPITRITTSDSTLSKPYIITASDMWPHARVGHTSTAIGDIFYVFGGRSGNDDTIEEHGQLWAFNSISKTWKALDPPSKEPGSFPEKRSYHSSTASNSHIFIHAGCGVEGRLSDTWQFSIADNTWTRLPDAPGPKRGGTAIAYSVKHNRIYRFGGFDGSEIGGPMDILDIQTNIWSSCAHESAEDATPGDRSVAAMQIVHDDYVVLLLGERDASKSGHAGAGMFWGDVWAFSILESKWIKVSINGQNGPGERGWLASDIVGKDGIIVWGGLNQMNERQGDGWMLSLSKP